MRLCDPIFADHLTQQRKVEHTFLSSSLSGELQNFLEKNPFPKKCMWIVTVPNLIIKQNVPSFTKWSYWFLKIQLKKFHSSQIRCKIALVQVSKIWSDSLLVKVQRSINGIQMACSVWFDAIVQHLQNCEETKVVAGLGQYSADNCGQSHLHSDEIFWSGRHGMARAWCRVVSGQLESVHRPLSPEQ